MKLQPYKIPVVHELHQPDPNKRLQFCNWVLEKVNSGELDAKEFFLATRRGFIYTKLPVLQWLKNRASVWEQRQFGSSGSFTPREEAGRPGKAVSDSRLLPRVVFGWLCTSLWISVSNRFLPLCINSAEIWLISVHILENVMLPSIRVWNPERNLIFQQDNHPMHCSMGIQRWFARRPEIELIPWPPKSPDFNVIEHVG